jgi:hypothetical protein
MRLNCDGPQHEPEGCDTYCPFGTVLPEGQTWEKCCEDCREELDRWADRYGEAVRDTIISSDLKDRP